MSKVAHFLSSVLFLIVCAGVWYLWRLGLDTFAQFAKPVPSSQIMRIATAAYPWLLLLPVPCIIYSAVLMDRVELLPEKVLVYFVSICLISTLLILGTLIMFAMDFSSTAAITSP